jgi:HTH-type transcriptional regulator/antitoxin HigA
MSDLKYTLISSTRQYDKYCKILEELVFSGDKRKAIKNEIDLLTLLIEKYDEEHTYLRNMDPIQLIQSLMADRNMRNIDLARLLGVSEGLVSDMLNRKKGLSKETMRILANEFKMSQDAFNQPYPIRLTPTSKVDSALATNIQQPMLMSEPPSDYGLEKAGKKKRKASK